MKKTKKLLAVLLAVITVLSLAACGSKKAEETEKATTKAAKTEAETKTAGTEAAATDDEIPEFEGKIGLMVGTVAISEEEYRTAQAWQQKLGEDKVVIQNYPDNFMSEEETTISNLVSLVSDPEVKAVVFNQGIPGAAAAIAKAKEIRPDVLYIVGGPNEDPDVITAAADLVIDSDDYLAGEQVAERAKEMGAETIVYYSFPRHQGYQKVAYGKAQLKETAESLGIQFVSVDIPDPQSDAGTAGTQQFVIEDVPKELEKYGPNTAFFDTNTMATPAVIKALYDAGEGIYMNPSQSSPFNGYPEALNISVGEDKTNDYEWVIEQIQAKLAETDDNGRFSTRTISRTIMTIDTGVEYSIAYLQGETNGEKVDVDVLEAAFNKAIGNAENVSFRTYDVDGEVYDNFILVLSPWTLL